MLQLSTPGAAEAVLKAPGELRLGKSADALRSEAHELLERGVRVLALDLSTVRAVDAAGVGALLETRNRVGEAGGTLVLLRPTERLRRLLDLCALTALFQIRDDDPTNENAPAAERNRVGGLLTLAHSRTFFE